MVENSDSLAVDLCGIRLRTPLMPAAGTLGREAFGEVKGVYGAILPKTVTPKPRAGNPPPRLAEAPAGIINSIGLQNPGIERFLEDLDDYDIGLPIIVSVAGDTVAEFAELCARLAGESRVAAVELNLSCPNTERGGTTFCARAETISEVVAACRTALPDKPLFAKLANEGALNNALASEEAGADALTLINTISALAVDPHTRRIFLKGGLSGPAIKPVALRAVYEVSRVVSVPVIGCGGVTSGTDAVAFMLAGASAVQVGSGGFVREPGEILEEFAVYLRDNELKAQNLTSALRSRDESQEAMLY